LLASGFAVLDDPLHDALGADPAGGAGLDDAQLDLEHVALAEALPLIDAGQKGFVLDGRGERRGGGGGGFVFLSCPISGRSPIHDVDARRIVRAR